MAGAGSASSGIGPAGFDEPTDTDRVVPVLPQAAFFDPALRDFPLDENGEIVSVHPVDQEMALRCGTFVRGLAPSPTTGLDWERLRRTSRQAMQSAIDDVVRQSTLDLVSRGDIELVGSPMLPEANGRPLFSVVYKNLRLPASPPRTLRVA